MTTQRVIIISPVFNDWKSAHKLLQHIDSLRLENQISVVLVDDASTEPYNIKELSRPYGRIEEIQILPLKRNCGHQRAIALGLAYVNANYNFDCVIVMDCDGEDQAAVIPELIQTMEKNDCSQIVLAKRGKRSEV